MAYIGQKVTTDDGSSCIDWTSVASQKSFIVDSNFPDKSVSEAKNYCRNPDLDSNGIWCYTSTSLTYKYCNSIPDCSAYDKIIYLMSFYN